MIKIYSPRRSDAILRRYAAWIDAVSDHYALPAGLLRAVLFKEMTEIDLLDLAADLVVAAGCFRKKDCSTGYGQIFGATGIRAINFALEHGMNDFLALGLSCDCLLDAKNADDVRRVWKLQHRSPKANIEIAALTLLCAAEEMTGRIEFASYSEKELKLILTRYNADVRHITPYGEAVYALYTGTKRQSGE